MPIRWLLMSRIPGMVVEGVVREVEVARIADLSYAVQAVSRSAIPRPRSSTKHASVSDRLTTLSRR